MADLSGFSDSDQVSWRHPACRGNTVGLIKFFIFQQFQEEFSGKVGWGATGTKLSRGRSTSAAGKVISLVDDASPKLPISPEYCALMCFVYAVWKQQSFFAQKI